MSRTQVERRLLDNSDRLKRMRAELAVVDEQLAVLAAEADETRVRALVAETPLADHEHRKAQRHADAMRRSRNAVAASISDLERAQDELLERLVPDHH